jgi:hypothetical protein
MEEIKLTKEEQVYIRQQIIERYIERKVVDLLDEDSIELSHKTIDDAIHTQLAKILESNELDNDLINAFKTSLKQAVKDGEFYEYSGIAELICDKLSTLFKC